MVPVRALMTPNVNLRFVLVYTIPRARCARGRRRERRPRRRRPQRASRAPLPPYEMAAAHDAVAQNAVGKVLVDVD